MCYFYLILDHPKATVAVIANALGNPVLGQVDCVVGIGLSGTMPLILVKEATGLSIMALRKEGASSHLGGEAHRPCVAPNLAARYVILDDFRATGDTVRGIISQLKRTRPKWTCAGVMFYHQGRDVGPSANMGGLPETELCLKDEVEEVVNLLEEGEELPCW